MQQNDGVRGRLLCIDADSTLVRAVASELAQAGFKVVAHTRHRSVQAFADGIDHEVSTDVGADLDAWLHKYGAFSHVVFGVRALDELSYDLEQDGLAFADLAESHIATFLADLRALALSMVRTDGRQIWVITQEDSMSYCLPMAIQPIVTGARHAAVKSLAREVLRFRLRLNCANVQLLEDELAPAGWQQARAALTAFATRFQPVMSATVAETLRSFMCQETIPFSGLILPFGVGIPEVNI
jgi:NAD(P)-dependent dehydrogenase (short-subunit alcohol dehydrogenase family)